MGGRFRIGHNRVWRPKPITMGWSGSLRLRLTPHASRCFTRTEAVTNACCAGPSAECSDERWRARLVRRHSEVLWLKSFSLCRGAGLPSLVLADARNRSANDHFGQSPRDQDAAYQSARLSGLTFEVGAWCWSPIRVLAPILLGSSAPMFLLARYGLLARYAALTIELLGNLLGETHGIAVR